jgi:crotonobetainyl-CoA:carnitine CoA-transferase CaiB-like acyl-CoA transferase
MADPSRPLAGIRIADLSRIWAGPYATRLLADMGADVIKVESPHLPPGTPYYTNRWLDEFNVGKRSLTLDLQTAAGVLAFKRLVAVPDILIENFSARVMGQLGLNYDALVRVKPDVIMLSMPGFGLSGPYRDYLAYGTVIEAMTGGCPS